MIACGQNGQCFAGRGYVPWLGHCLSEQTRRASSAATWSGSVLANQRPEAVEERVQGGKGGGERAVELAVSARLRGSDAVYACIAQQSGTILVTLDRQQVGRLPCLMPTVRPADLLPGPWPGHHGRHPQALSHHRRRVAVLSDSGRNVGVQRLLTFPQKSLYCIYSWVAYGPHFTSPVIYVEQGGIRFGG